ncbi:MAG: hypothetical protein RIF41_35270 [Polyangiaceae bacterium]
MRSHAVGLTVALALSPAIARAEEPLGSGDVPEPSVATDPPEDSFLPAHRPTAAFTLRAGSGTWSPLSSDGIDDALVRAGLPPMTDAMPTFDVAIGGNFGRFSVELQAGGVFDAARSGHSTVTGMRAYALLGYRVLDELPISIMPTMGVGTTWLNICANRPGPGGRASGPSFLQVLRNPGPTTCVSSGDAAVLRAGMAFDLDALFDDVGTIAGLRLRLEPAIEVPFRRTRWRTHLGGEEVMLEGPLGPPIGLSFGVSVGGVIGF